MSEDVYIGEYAHLVENEGEQWDTKALSGVIADVVFQSLDLQDIDKIMESLKRTNNQEEKIVNKIIDGVHDNGI